MNTEQIEAVIDKAREYDKAIREKMDRQIKILETINKHTNQGKILIICRGDQSQLLDNFNVVKAEWNNCNLTEMALTINYGGEKPNEQKKNASWVNLANVTEVSIIEETEILDRKVKLYTKIF